MTSHGYRLYLNDIQHAAIDARRAREALEEAEHMLTRVPTADMSEVHVRSSATTDAMCARVHGYQQQREAALSRLRSSLEALDGFRFELQESQLRDIACRALWLRHALGQSYDRIAAELRLTHSTCWRLCRDAEIVLGESLGVVGIEPSPSVTKRLCRA